MHHAPRRRTSRSLALASLATVMLALAAGDGARGEPPTSRVLLVVRVDSQTAEGSRPMDDGLRELALGGTSMSHFSPRPSQRSLEWTSSAIADTILDEDVTATLQSEGIRPLRLHVGIDRERLTGDGRSTAGDLPAELAALREHFGKPSTSSDATRADSEFSGKVHRILALDRYASPTPQVDVSPPERRVERAIDGGSRLTIVTESLGPTGNVGDPSTESAASSWLDRLVDSGVAGRDGLTVVVLTLLAGREPPAGSLIVHGPRVQAGWVRTGRFHLEEIGPTCLYLLSSQLVPQKRLADVIDGLVKN